MDALEQELVKMICEVCKVEGGVPEDFSPAAPLIGPESPLGIDSLTQSKLFLPSRTAIRSG